MAGNIYYISGGSHTWHGGPGGGSGARNGGGGQEGQLSRRQRRNQRHRRGRGARATQQQQQQQQLPLPAQGAPPAPMNLRVLIHGNTCKTVACCSGSDDLMSISSSTILNS